MVLMLYGSCGINFDSFVIDYSESQEETIDLGWYFYYVNWMFSITHKIKRKLTKDFCTVLKD